MPHEIIYPQGCRPVTEDLGPDELIRRLKTLAHTLQAMGQDEGMYQQYIPLALHLAEDHFLQHHSKDVQLLIACCIADVLRVYAPEAPYKDQEKVKTIFQFLIKQLGGLKDPKDPAFKRYFYLLENLAYVKSFNMCFELEDCQEIFCGLFSLMFKIVNDEHSSKVKSFMLDVLCPLITESDIVSNELLDIILQNVVDPLKSQRKNAYLLAKDLIIKTCDTLEPYIQSFFNHVLIFGKEEKGLTIYTKVFDLIYELNKICPSILIAVLPQLEVKLKSAVEEERLGAVSLLARMFSEKDSTLAQTHQALWNAFLGRFNDINIFIRIKCVQYSMHFLINHPELRQDITDTLKMRQHDPDETVRYEVVMAIVATAKRDFEVVSESEDLLEFVKERTLDKKFKIRKEAMTGLAMIYRKHLNEQNPPAASRKAVTWIKDKILHGYYMTSMEDRLLVERLLNTCLVPFQFPAAERMKKLYHLLGTIDNNAIKAFLELQRYQMYARKTLAEWVELHKKVDPVAGERPRELEAKSHAVAKYLPDQVKAMEFLGKLSADCLRDSSLLHGLERIVDPTISCKDCAETMGLVLKKFGQPVMTNLYYNTVKMLLERCSSVMVDSESIKILINYVEECMRGGNLLDELGLHPNTAGERGLKMLMILAYVFPAHFYQVDIISHLVRMAKSDDPMVLSVLIFLGKYKPVFEQFPEVAEEYRLVDLCKEYIEKGTPKHAKQAVRCLHVNLSKSGEVYFHEIIEKVRMNLNPDSHNYLTSIVAFGHIAQNLPEAFPVLIKNVVSRKIVKELLVKNNEHDSDLPKDMEWCTEEELPYETRCKVEGLKAMARWLLGLKNDTLAAQKTFRMLTAFIAKKGDLLQTGKLSKAEMGWLRLAAGCAMLRICEQKGVGDQFFAQQFYTLSTLVNDETYEVRERFLNKLHKGLSRGLPNKGLPLDFMGFYALMGFEENRRLKSTTKHQMCTQVAKRRDYAKSMSVTNMCSIEKAMEVLPRILPDYMILFAIPVLTHSPEFTDPSDHNQLARVRNGLLAVLEPLITKNDFYCFGFYKEMIDSAKSCRDACNPDDELTNTKMWAICDLTMALLLQKSTNFDYKDIQSETRIPAMFFKRNPDPNYVNTRTYIPIEFQYTGPIGNKKPTPPLVNINPSRRGKKGKVPPTTSTNQHQHQMSNDAKAAETQIRLPGMESESDTEPDQPVVKKVRTKENGSFQ